ncbi:phage tail protein [Flavobacterium sp.]|uniref:phage tail protein n=1 Tax=Flavobacterium sp. TaxID=239 RepID=UPI002635E5DE|nr:phage tail protein [Flavobacterium sp.]
MSDTTSLAFSFQLSFLLGYDYPFQEVAGLEIELKEEEITSNDENQYIHKLPSTSKHQNLVLKKGLSTFDSPLLHWCSSTIASDLSNTIETQNLLLSLLDSNGVLIKKWLFYDAYPVNYSVTGFQSVDNSIIVDSIEFAYNYFKVVK